MKKITPKYVVSRLLIAFFCCFLFQSSLIAQTNSYLSWNSQVGCISYDSSGTNPNNPTFTEEIQNTQCVKVCELSTVVYTVNGADVQNVQWTVAGGTLTTSGTANKVGTVSWSSAGSGLVEVLITYPKNITRRVTVCIEKINSPKANFKFYGAENSLNFCLNSPINFQNLSLNNGGSDIVTYAWNFGDGNYSTAFEPTHSYSQPGTYPVKLTVTNNCGCAATYSVVVNISNAPAAVINHPAVICQNNDVHSYSADSDCAGEWSIVGGVMQNITGTSVDVIWNNVNSDGFGYLSYRSQCTCMSWTTIKIPVIRTSGVIDGNKNICLNEQGLFSLPSYPSTQYTWSLSGNSLNNIVATDQRNEIFVDGLQAGTYTLSCHYTNTILGCSGDATMQVNILKPIEILGASAFCSGNANVYTSIVGSVTWVLKNGNVTVATSTGNTFSNPFTAAGVYTLTATSPSYCSAQKIITVEQTPTAPVGTIVGDAQVCAGQPYQYTFNNTEPNTILVWSVSNGTILGPNTGNTMTAQFNANASSYTITVQRRSTGPLGCLSPVLTRTISPLNLVPVITSNSNATTFCPSSQSSFTVNLGGVTPDFIEWTVPAELGSIVSGVNSGTVTINWNETSGGPVTGSIQVRVKKCNPDATATFNVTVLQNPVLTLSAPASLCFGDVLNVSLSATPAITAGTITWNFGNGTTTNTAVNASGNYSFPYPYSGATTSPNINYAITATINSPNGCGVLTASDVVIAYPKKVITITPGSSFIVCPATYQSLTLYSNSGSGITAAVSYKWYKNGTQVSGAGGATYTITGANPGGTYYVRVTDINGCTSQSQTVTVQENCNPGTGLGECSPSPDVTLTGGWAECDKLFAQFNYTGPAPTSVQWLGSQFISLSSSGPTSAYFTSFDQVSPIIPGVHIITVKLIFPTCVVTRSVAITKNYTPDFVSTIACNSGNNLTYNVTLQNNSTIFNTPAIPIAYTFTGTGIATPQAGQSITLNNVAPGTYNYYMTVSSTAPGKPSCTIMKTLVLPALPNLNFTLADVNYCANEPITLTIPNYNAANNYTWHFAGRTYHATSATSVVSINTGGTFPITLQATTALGCTISSNPINVTVNSQLFNGTLSANPAVVCTGTPPIITYTSVSGGATPSSYTWMNGTTEVATTTTATYSPTATGTYWVKLAGTGGCKYAGLGNASVTILPVPFVGITGSSSICQGEQTTLQGNVQGNNVERRWLLNNTPVAGAAGTWTAATTANLTLVVPGTLPPATYNYTLEVRYATGNGCTANTIIPVRVFAPTPLPMLSYSITSCEPYKVKINVTNPVTGGLYNWSNGAVGTSIEVNDGGAYLVSYTGPAGGCDATASITVPHPFLWDFPGGFYDICMGTTPTPFILAPLGTVTSYQWIVNNQIAGQGANTNVQNQPLNQVGNYQLVVNKDGCIYESGIITIAPNEDCPSYPNCKLSFNNIVVEFINGQYQITADIQNGELFPVTFTFSSLNNFGTYTPATMTLPASIPGNPVTFTFSATFIPNSNFDGGLDEIVIQRQGCYNTFPIEFINNEAITARIAPEKAAAMQIEPNPAQDFTIISYDLGTEYKQAENLTVYSLLGVPLTTVNLKAVSGKVQLSTAQLTSGTYIISIHADGQRALQQTLIKK